METGHYDFDREAKADADEFYKKMKERKAKRLEEKTQGIEHSEQVENLVDEEVEKKNRLWREKANIAYDEK
jgi:hypothetical protein